jgi:toxin-antitoxin system PIN domain toxin
MASRPVQLLDVNLLVALCLTTHQHHRPAHRFLGGITGRWATCPITESALIRLLLNPAATGSQRSFVEIRGIVSGLRQDPRWTFVDDDSTLATATVDPSVLMGHQQVTDLHLVNLAARHGARLATLDAELPTWLAPADRHHVVVVAV